MTNTDEIQKALRNKTLYKILLILLKLVNLMKNLNKL